MEVMAWRGVPSQVGCCQSYSMPYVDWPFKQLFSRIGVPVLVNTTVPLTLTLFLLFHSDVEAVAKLITSFLELDRIESQQDLSQSSETEASDADEPQDKYQSSS